MPQPNPSGESWERLSELLDEAVRLGPDHQAAFLQKCAADDPSTAHELERLLRASQRMGPFLQQPIIEVEKGPAGPDEPASDLLRDPLIGRTLGHVRIEYRIDRGGMSSVYAGRHLHDDRRVAVKVLRPSRSSATFAKRLEREAKLLARLDHPGIARMLDSGMFDLGDGAQPYIVMELIDGDPLHRLLPSVDPTSEDTCNDKLPDVRTRVALIVEVARAVQHAHDRGVLHRDIKPGNILVTRDEHGVLHPKVLDFGLSRISSEGADAESLAASLTETNDIVGTLRYMSPEQLEGDATVRSDVHALGVVGFELLTGSLPYARSGRTDAPGNLELLQLIRRPERERLSRIDTRIDPALSAVFGKATAAEPAQRYASAQAFAEDLEAWLDGRPVSVRPPTRTQELRAFIHRHRTIAVTALLFAMLLLAGSAATAWQALRATRAQSLAEQRFTEVRGLARAVIFELEPAIARLPGSTSARHLLVDRAIAYLERLEESAGGDPEFLLELAEAWARIAQVLGDPDHLNLGRTNEAAAAYRKALDFLDRVSSGESRERRLQRTQLLASFIASDNQWGISIEERRERHPLARKTLELVADLHRESPDLESTLQLADLFARFGIAKSRYGVPDQALPHLNRARALLASIPEPHRLSGSDAMRYVRSRFLISAAYDWEGLDPILAEESARDALELLDTADLEDVPPMLSMQIRLRVMGLLASTFAAQERPEEAAAQSTATLEASYAFIEREPDDFTTRRTIEIMYAFRSGYRWTMARDPGRPIDERLALYDFAIADLEEAARRYDLRVAVGKFNEAEIRYPEMRQQHLESMLEERAALSQPE